jgi:hypothetical protein
MSSRIKGIFLIIVGLANVCLAQLPQETQLNRIFGNAYYPNEPSIAISQIDSNAIVAAANINNMYNSTDQGKTWKERKIQSLYGIWGDPVLHSDQDGQFYFLHLSRTSGEGMHKKYRFIDRIVVQTSQDSGRSFNDGTFLGYNEGKMQDKPWISTDDGAASRFYNNAYVTWTEFDQINSKKRKHKSRIRFSSSSNKGDKWSEAITISDETGDAVDDDHTLEGATTAVGDSGIIYCVWAGHYKLYFDKSTDGGRTWGKDRIIANQESGWAMNIDHVQRSNGMPFVVCDQSNGPFHGRIYVVFGDDKFGDADVFLMHSDDRGKTWSNPTRVNGDLVGNGKDQYLPNIALNQTSGELAILYYDRRLSPKNVFNDVVVAISKNGGENFVETRLNTLFYSHHGARTFSGDYIDLDFVNGRIAATWTGFVQIPRVYASCFNAANINNTELMYASNQFVSYTEYEGDQITEHFRTNQNADITVFYQTKLRRKKYRKTITSEHHIECVNGTELTESSISFPYSRGMILKIEVRDKSGTRIYDVVKAKKGMK